MPIHAPDVWRRGLTALAVVLLVACGAPTTPAPDPDPDPDPEPTPAASLILGTGFSVVPADAVFAAPFAVEVPVGGAAVACVLTLDDAPLATVPAPCSDGSVEVGPFAVGTLHELTLTTTPDDGEPATVTWSFTAERWAPFQRLEGDAPVRAIAGSGARLAVLRSVPSDAVAVLERPPGAAAAGTWAPARLADVGTVVGFGDLAAVAWHQDELALLPLPIDGVVEVTRHRQDESGWFTSRATGIAWSEPFGAPRFAVSDELTVIGDATIGDGGRWAAATPVGFLDEADAWPDAYPAAVAGDLAGAAVAALGDVVVVGHPGADPSGTPPAPNGRVHLIASEPPAADGLGGGFASGPGSAIGRHLAVADTPDPVLFQAGARDVEWGRVDVEFAGDAEPGDPGERVLNVLGSLSVAGARWIAVATPPPSDGPTLLSAFLAIGLPDDTVALYLVPLAGPTPPFELGRIDATGATGPGAWVGGALALAFGDDVVLYDAVPPPPPSDD